MPTPQNAPQFPPASSLSFRAKTRRGDEVDHREGRKREEHRRISILTHGRKKDGCNRSWRPPDYQQSDAHSVRSNSGRHQLRQREPHAHSGADREKRHKDKEAGRYQPAVTHTRHGSNQGIVDFEWSSSRRFQIGEWVREEGDDPVIGHAAFTRDLNRLGRFVVRARYFGRRAEISIGINDDEGCRMIAQRLAGSAACADERIGKPPIVKQCELLVAAYQGLNGLARVDT